jgi:hypothetical protein
MGRRCEMSDVLTEAAEELAALQAEISRDVLLLAMDNVKRWRTWSSPYGIKDSALT